MESVQAEHIFVFCLLQQLHDHFITSSLHMIPPQTTKTSGRQPIPAMGTTKMRRITSATKRQDVDVRCCVNQVKKEISHASVPIRRHDFTH
jgi:hypothetical protein